MSITTTIERPIHIDHPHLVQAADAERLRDLARDLIREHRPEEAELVLRATVAAAPSEDQDGGFHHPVAVTPRDRAAIEHKLVVDYLAMKHDLQDFDRYMRGGALWPETDEEPSEPEPYLKDQADDVESLLSVAKHLAERGSIAWAETVARVAAQRCPDLAAGRPSQAFRVWFAINDELEVTGLLTREEYRSEMAAIYDIDTGMAYHHDCPACPEHRAESGDELVDFDVAEARFAAAKASRL